MSLKALRWTKKYIAFSFLFVHSLSCCYLFAVFVFICSLSMHYCANRHEFISVFHLHQNHRSSGWQTCGKNRRCSCPHVWLFDCRALLRRFRLPCISLSIVSSWLVLDYFSLELSRSLFLHTHSPLLGLLRCSVKWSKAMPWWKRWKAWGASAESPRNFLSWLLLPGSCRKYPREHQGTPFNYKQKRIHMTKTPCNFSLLHEDRERDSKSNFYGEQNGVVLAW